VESRLTTGSEATFTGLPAGISVKITITARLTNGAVTAPRQKRYPTPTPADQPLGSKLK
jgi:hypothetical protein